MVTRQSVWTLIAANAGAILIAIALQWPPALLMWPFLLQSIVIGYYSRRRMLALKQFSTDNLKINNQPVEPTPETQRWVANFFVLHFGAFHLAYLVFLLSDAGALQATDWLVFGAMTAGFVWNHRSSYEQHIAADREGCPNIGTMMFLPYLRVVPMHLTIGLAAASGMEGTLALLLFGALKTLADVGMHYAEHKGWQAKAKSV